MQQERDRERDRETNRERERVRERDIGSEMEVQRGDLSLEFEGECRQTVKLSSRAEILDSKYDINE